jgi:hypothetical protein
MNNVINTKNYTSSIDNFAKKSKIQAQNKCVMFWSFWISFECYSCTSWTTYGLKCLLVIAVCTFVYLEKFVFVIDISFDTLFTSHSPRTFIPAVGTAPYTAGNGALNDRKRRFTALIFTLFHRNPSVRITTAVSGRFLLWNDHRFTPFLYTFLDWRITTAVSGRFSPVYSRFRPFTHRSVGPGLFFNFL